MDTGVLPSQARHCAEQSNVAKIRWGPNQVWVGSGLNVAGRSDSVNQAPVRRSPAPLSGRLPYQPECLATPAGGSKISIS